MSYLEDLVIGVRTEIGRHTFTAEEIKLFAARYDPQPFHIDEEAARRSHYGGLIASGWHTAAVCMRFLAAHLRDEAEADRRRGDVAARTGVSPGFRDLKWLKPVYVGDTLAFATEVVDRRPLNTSPIWGLVFSRNIATNQTGVLVFSFVSAMFIERRPGTTRQPG